MRATQSSATGTTSAPPARRHLSRRTGAWRRGACVLAVIPAVVLSACSSSSSGSSATSGSSANPGSSATSEGESDLSIGYVAIGGQQAILSWGQAKGYFKREGVNLTVQVTKTGTTAALVSGRIDLVLGSPANLFKTIDAGKAIKYIFESDTSPLVAVAADPKITSITQCKTMATGASGTNASAGTTLAGQEFHQSWSVIQLTDPTAFGPTVISGRADCGIGPNILYQSSILQGKLHVVFNSAVTADLPPGWPGGTMQTIQGLSSTLSAKADTISKFLKAYLSAMKDFKATPSPTLAKDVIATGGEWSAVTPAVLGADIDAVKSALLPNAGYPTSANWQAMLKFQANGGLAIVNPSDSKWSFESLVDTSYYDKGIGKPSGG